MQRILLLGSACSAIINAPVNVAPAEIPVKMPSFCASNLELRIASDPEMASSWSMCFRSTAWPNNGEMSLAASLALDEV